jgi:hypothetical protein
VAGDVCLSKGSPPARQLCSAQRIHNQGSPALPPQTAVEGGLSEASRQDRTSMRTPGRIANKRERERTYSQGRLRVASCGGRWQQNTHSWSPSRERENRKREELYLQTTTRYLELRNSSTPSTRPIQRPAPLHNGCATIIAPLTMLFLKSIT